MTEELKAFGRQLDITQISWTVAENNPNAVRFYEQKMHAHVLPYGLYDCGDLFTKQQPPASQGVDVRRVDKADLDLIETYVGSVPGLTKEKMSNIRDAAAAGNVNVFAAFGSDGAPQAIGITNSNYSSFRTVYGYKFEVLEMVADTKTAVNALNALTAHVVATGKTDDHTGHLNIVIDNKSAAQTQFMQGIGASRLQMTDDPASVFAVYGIGRDIIYPAQATPVIKDVPAKKPDAPKTP